MGDRITLVGATGTPNDWKSPVISAGNPRALLDLSGSKGCLVGAITAKMAKPKLPTHIGIKATGTGIERDSVILLEQIRTIDKSRLKEKVCHLDRPIMAEVDRALKISVGIEALTPVTK